MTDTTPYRGHPLFKHDTADPLDSSSFLQKLRQLVFLSLKIRIPTDMLVVDEDIGYGALVGYLLEGILDGCSIIYN